MSAVATPAVIVELVVQQLIVVGVDHVLVLAIVIVLPLVWLCMQLLEQVWILVLLILF